MLKMAIATDPNAFSASRTALDAPLRRAICRNADCLPACRGDHLDSLVDRARGVRNDCGPTSFGSKPLRDSPVDTLTAVGSANSPVGTPDG
jgi:hypothetical protein